MDIPFDMTNLAGQGAGLVALALCVVAFASRRDDTLLVILLFANIAFAVQYVLFDAWVAAGIAVLVIVRILLARRWPGNWLAMGAILVGNGLVAIFNWTGPIDLLPLLAGTFGTVAMFMARGIPMRLLLVGTAVCWIATNLAIGSIGATLAESMILVTNLITIYRMRRDRQRVTG